MWLPGGWVRVALTDRRRQHSLLGPVKPTWCCHGMEGTSDTWTKPAPPFTAPVSSVPYHFSTGPSSLTPPPPTTTTTSSQPAATYITLTNQRLRGFFSFCLAFTADIYFSESTVPVSGLKTNTRSQTIHPPFISVSPVVYLNPPVCQCKSASLLTLASLYLFTPPFPPTPPTTLHFFSSPATLFPFIVLRSWAYWHVTVEWACLRFCDVRNSVD